MWSTKIASKWRFFVPGLYIFLKFFIFFGHTPLDHHALRYTVNAVSTTEPEVGVERPKSVKMQVFRPWTFEIRFYILQEASTDHGPPFIIAAVTTTNLEVGVEPPKSVKMQVFRL